jgi:hypothetical protein
MDQTLRINSIYLFLLHQLIYLPCGIINLKSSKISKKKKKDKYITQTIQSKESFNILLACT